MNEKQRNKLERQWSKEDRQLVDGEIARLLSTKSGRKALWWLLQIGRVGAQPFTNNALSTAFECGQLNVGQQILDRIVEVQPAGYVQMIEDQADDRRIRDERLSRGDATDGDDPDPTERYGID